MKHLYLLPFLFLLALTGRGQQLRIAPFPTVACLDQNASIDLQSSLAFHPDNEFTVKLQESYMGSYSKTIKASRVGNTIVFSLKDLNLPENLIAQPVQLKVISSNPVQESNWSNSFYIGRTATATLTGSTAGTINPYESSGLKFALSGTPPITVLMSDSSRYELSGDYYRTTYTAVQPVSPARSTTYTIAQVRNGCGVGTGSGSASITVNPFGLRTNSVSTPRVCIGGELQVGFSTQRGAFQAGNQFKIRLSRLNTNVYPNEELSDEVYDLPATLEDGELKTIIPASMPASVGYAASLFSVRVVASSPAVIGDAAGFRIELKPAPGAEFTTGSQTIALGSQLNLGVRFSGLEPYQATLSDGTTLYQGYYTEYEQNSPIRPRQSTVYAIRSLQTGCGDVPVRPNSSVAITVLPGIAIDSVTSEAICEGQTLRIKFFHNLSLRSDNQFLVTLKHGYEGTPITVPARQAGDYLEFVVPPIPLARTAYRTGSFSLQVSSSSPAYRSDWKSDLTVQTHPDMVWSEYNQYVLEKPQSKVSWSWTGYGGGPYEIVLDDGRSSTTTIWDSHGYLSIPGYESRNYQVKSIKNTCFTSPSPARASLTVQVPAERYILVKPYREAYCRGDSVEINFEALGSFQPGNLFRVQARTSSSCCSFPETWATVSAAGTVKFKLPDELGWYSTGSAGIVFRIASTNPVLFSEEMGITIHRPPYGISYKGDAKEVLLTSPISDGGEVAYYGGTPMTIRYTVNGKDFTQVTNQMYSAPISYPVYGNTTFTLTSLSNACGAVPGNKTIRYTFVPYVLGMARLANLYEFVSYCAGTTASLAYTLKGTPDPGLTLSVQISPAAGGSFTTLARGLTGNPVSFRFPDSLQAGDYRVRLVSNLNIATDEQLIRIRRKPTATLTTETGANQAQVWSGGSSALKVALSGSSDWNVSFSDGFRTTYTNDPGFRYVQPGRKTTYSLTSVTNTCGYGVTAGEVSVTVQPSLLVNTGPTGVNTFCVGAKIPVRYETRGDFEAGNRIRFALFDAMGTRRIAWLDSTASQNGTQFLTLPASLTTGSYVVQASSTNPVLNANVQILLEKAPALVLGGNSVINPQQAATLQIVSKEPVSWGSSLRYVLSDGTAGDFYAYGNTTNVIVRPQQTTTYRLTSASNSCGAGTVEGSATVEVNPVSDRLVNTGSVTTRAGSAGLCSSDTMVVHFETQGAFSAGNRFTVQLSDATGSNFQNLTTIGNSPPLRAVVPANLPQSSYYRVRVRASDANTSSSTNPEPLSMKYAATASFESASVLFEPGKSVALKINLTGDSPWYVLLGNEFNPVATLSIPTSPYSVTVSPLSTQSVYKLYRVTNVCGLGEIRTPSTLQISVLTALEMPLGQEVKVFPNPTTGQVRVELPGSVSNAVLKLTDSRGKLIRQTTLTGQPASEDLSGLPAGVYFLQVDHGARRGIYRIVKF